MALLLFTIWVLPFSRRFFLISSKMKRVVSFLAQQKSINKISFKDERENLFGGGRFLHVFGVVAFQLTIANFTHVLFNHHLLQGENSHHAAPKICRFVQGS